jgi:hypothetical protein
VTNRNPAKASQRHGETPWHHCRSGRSFLKNRQWFFRTREGIDVGPYLDQDAAEFGATWLSGMLDGLSDAEITEHFIREFMLLRDK